MKAGRGESPIKLTQSVAPTLKSITTTLTTAQLAGLFAAPRTLLAAPGAGKVIVPVGMGGAWNKTSAVAWVPTPVLRLYYGSDPGAGPNSKTAACADLNLNSLGGVSVNPHSVKPLAYNTLFTYGPGGNNWNIINTSLILVETTNTAPGASDASVTVTIVYYVMNAI